MLYLGHVTPALRGLTVIVLGLASTGCAGGGASSSIPHVSPADSALRTVDGGKGAAPSPTPAPTAPPQFLIVTPNQPAINVVAGTTTTVTCALTVQSGDRIDGAYKILDWGNLTRAGGTGTFPIRNYPLASSLSSRLAGSSTFTLMANDGAPGQTLYSEAPSAQQTRCIDLEISAPITQAAGTYSTAIAYEMFGTASANGTGIAHEVVSTVATFNVVVTP